MVLKKTVESPSTGGTNQCKEIKPVHPKGNQAWGFIGTTDGEAVTSILWPLDVKNRLLWKDSDAGKDWRQEEKGWQRMSWLDGITNLMDVSLSNLGTGKPGVLQSMGLQRIGHDWGTELNWTKLCSMSGSNCCLLICIQISQEAGMVVWYSHLFTSFPHFVVIHTVKCFRVVKTQKLFTSSEILFLFYGSQNYCHYPYRRLTSCQTTGREQSPIHQQKVGLKMYWIWPLEQEPVFSTASPSHQEASTSLVSSSIQGRQNENHNHRKLSKLITWITALSNSMKLWAIHEAPPKAEMVESSDRMWSLEKGMVNHQHSCLENPPNIMKRNHKDQI